GQSSRSSERALGSDSGRPRQIVITRACPSQQVREVIDGDITFFRQSTKGNPSYFFGPWSSPFLLGGISCPRAFGCSVSSSFSLSWHCRRGGRDWKPKAPRGKPPQAGSSSRSTRTLRTNFAGDSRLPMAKSWRRRGRVTRPRKAASAEWL